MLNDNFVANQAQQRHYEFQFNFEISVFELEFLEPFY